MTYSDEMKKKIFQKGAVIIDEDSDKIRKDECGAIIHFDEYGNRNSDYGWEIDHICPKSENGKNDLKNLRPLQWKNNLDKDNGRLKCNVVSVKKINIDLSLI